MERAAGRTVLVVEDDEDVLGLIADLLRERGHTVHAAYDGESALRRLGAGGVDLILLDLSLPDMSGKEFLEIRERVAQLATIPVVILSGSEDARSCGERRSISVLRKPFGATELLGVVEVGAGP